MQHLRSHLSRDSCPDFRRFRLVTSGQVPVANDVFVGEVYGATLAREKVYLVEQARDEEERLKTLAEL